MNYRTLGQSGLKVSALTLGTMMFGEQTSTEDSLRIIDKAWDQGINFIDTADVYTGGRSEEIVGEAIARNRHDWVVASKVGFGPTDGVPNRSGLSRKRLFNALDASLARLDTDYLDIYYLHREDHDTPVDETLRALDDVIRAGKIRGYGLSNHRGWKLAEFSRSADLLGIQRPSVSQPLYNLANRQIEVEHLPAAEHYGIGVISYSPLARGVLTGKYDPDQPPGQDTRAGRNDPRLQQTEWRPESLNLAQRIRDYAEGQGITAGQFALAWVLNNQLITSAIAGPRTEQQWEDYVPALNYRFTAQDEAFINDLVVTGHSTTPGYNDPSHPFFGRKSRV